MNASKVSRETLAKVVVKSRQNASRNPFAQEKKKVTCEQVLNSPMVADPLSKLDIYPISDGAAAMILATESKAKLITDKPVWILGGGCCYDNFYLGDRNLAESEALKKAGRRAYQMAGIKQPSRQLSLAEISAYYSYQEPLWCEGLGLCPDGKGGKFVESGESALDGKLPVNPSGGPLAGNPQMVGGIVRAVECSFNLEGKLARGR
jgi:acetyl-CoA C-acetyltransferase